jgi:hypothetical protein
MYQNWLEALRLSLTDLWYNVVSWVPSLIVAVIVFIVGLLVSSFLGGVVEKIISAIKLDNFLRKLGLEEYTKRANIQLNSGYFIGQVVYWFLVLVFLFAASDIIRFTALTIFLSNVLAYIPSVIVAALIMAVSFVAANIISGIVRASVMGAGLHRAKFLGSASWWAIMITGILSALDQLGISVAIINTLITGLIAMISIAGGLAFGLGGKESAARLIQEIGEELEGKK